MTLKSKLHVEGLEVRDCPAASVFHGVLTVTGGGGDDNIVVNRNGNKISVNGQSFNAGGINRVVITAGSGDDNIVDNSGKSAVIYGGMGNDRVNGGRGHDTIYGGEGDDRLDGGRGDDSIRGGGGTDTVEGGTGNNSVSEGSPTVSRGNTGLEAQIIQLINGYRTSNGVRALKVNGQLNYAAELHSQDMAMIGGIYGPNKGMQHDLTGTAHPKVTDRFDAAGYDTWEWSFSWGENIAYGFTTAASVVQAWIDSPSHRQNILNGNFTETGVSVARDVNGVLYYTQTFGDQS